MTSKHTPGPWRVEEDFSIYSDGEDKAICNPCQTRTLKEQCANAHLIAAAPDLLEACKFAVDYLEKNPTRHTITDKLKQVLSKAEPSINKGA